MWCNLLRSGFNVGDSTSGLFPLLVGLVSVVWISVAFLVFLTIQNYWSRRSNSEAECEPTACELASVDHREAA